MSGSGKSSVLRAGLIYQLQQERRLPGTEQWKIRIFTPGEQRVADQIFIKLTQLGEGTPDTRKQIPQQDLVAQSQSADLVEQVTFIVFRYSELVVGGCQPLSS